MSTFAELAAKPGVGLAYLVDVSTDGFATILHRWGTGSGYFNGGNAYDQRILSVGNLTRSMGSARSMTAATVALTLDNADAALDFLVDRTTFASVTNQAQFRLYMALFDPASPGTNSLRTLGIFACLDQPSRDAATVKLSLADPSIDAAAQAHRPPSLMDWGSLNNITQPVPSASSRYDIDANPAVNWDAPLPVRLGWEIHPMQRAIGSTYVVCAVKQSRAAAPAFDLYAVYDGEGRVFPSSVVTITRSADIVVDGETWHVIYCTLALAGNKSVATNNPGRNWLKQNYPDVEKQFFSSVKYNTLTGEPYGLNWTAVDGLGFGLRGKPLSSVVNSSLQGLHPADIAKELLSTYSMLGASNVNTDSFDSAKAQTPGVFASGTLDASFSGAELTGPDGARRIEMSGGTLRAALSDLGAIGRFDIVFDSYGTAYAKSMAQDFTALTTTPTAIDETLMGDVQERIASKSERWEPVTDVTVTARGVTYGPFVSTPRLAGLGKHSTLAISTAWLGPESVSLALGSVLSAYGLRLARAVAGAILMDSAAVRPILRFRTSLEAVTLELGDFITASWTRGGRGTPYASARWRVESWTLQSENGCVDIEAVWCADLDDTARRPYLLDNEALLVRLAGVDDLDLTPGSGVVVFTGAVNLTASGVLAGDVLVMRDSTEAATAFLTNQAFRIVSVDSSLQATVTPALDAGAPLTLLGADWTIYRGATTYPTAVSDPVNYPSGGAMYGKASNGGTYSDSSAANLLLNG